MYGDDDDDDDNESQRKHMRFLAIHISHGDTHEICVLAIQSSASELRYINPKTKPAATHTHTSTRARTLRRATHKKSLMQQKQ